MAETKNKAQRKTSLGASAGSAHKVLIVVVDDLWVGDRFRAYGSLWTYLGEEHARKHSPESIALNERGYGYIGDTICSFRRRERVEFVAPNVALCGGPLAGPSAPVRGSLSAEAGIGDSDTL